MPIGRVIVRLFGSTCMATAQEGWPGNVLLYALDTIAIDCAGGARYLSMDERTTCVAWVV